MKKFLSKTVSAVLAASMVFSIAACTKNGGKSGSHGGRLISADTPWFDAKTLDIDLGIDESREKEYSYSQMAGMDEKYMVILTSGNYKMPSNFNWETDNYYDYVFANVAVVDRATNEVVNRIDIKDFIDKNAYPDNAIYKDGKILVSASTYDEKTYDVVYNEYDVDPMTGDILDTRVKETTDQISGVYTAGKYTIETAGVWTEEKPYFNLYIKTADSEEKKVELKDEKSSIYGVEAVIPLTETTVLLPCSMEMGSAYYELDLESLKLTKADSKEYSWLSDISLYNLFVASDGSVYSSTPVGISKIDFSKKTVEEVFNYSWCGINRSVLTDLSIVDISGDSFVLCGEVYSSSPFLQGYDWNNSKFQVIEFSKAAKNPHEGKRVLELFTAYGYTDNVMSEAIAQYNETNGKYFIEVTDRYVPEVEYDYSNINSDDQESEMTNNYYADMSNKLSIDIMNGDGPDMFLDISHLNQLNNGNYLADLTPYVGNLDQNKYFTNIIDISKENGKLYNLPLCFGITGIHTGSEYAGASGSGFTTAEYQKFLHDRLNGEDVIKNGQAYYFTTLFNAMRDKFIVNGKADFTGPEFAELAEYVKDNVQETSKEWGEGEYGSNVIVYGGMVDEEIKPAIYGTSYGFLGYFEYLNQLNGADAILGLPSSDGRGPMATPYTSIAVSAQAYDVDACGEFVKLLLSDEFQAKYSENGDFVLNRECFRKTGEEAVKFFNENNINALYGYYSDDMPDNRVKYTTEHIDKLENIILNCSIMFAEDGEINKVLCEEMPAYFSGQKELSEVVAIAQERVQKILNERG